MKTRILSTKALAGAVSLILPALALAQSGSSGSGSSGTAGSTGTGSSATSGTGTNGSSLGGSGAGSAMWSNPEALFKQLDTNSDGQISREEFARISSLSSGSSLGTGTSGSGTSGTGTSGSGATGSSSPR
jgi:hypothetical protein